MVNLEQSLISQEQELLNPPTDGPVPEVALYRALRMAELAILGELERLNNSHKLTGLQLEYKVVEIPETDDDDRMEVLQQEAPVFSVRLGKLIGQEKPKKIEKYQNQNLQEEDQDSLNIESIINLVEKIKEYLILHTPPYKLLNNKIHLNLKMQLNSRIITYETCDRECRKKCGHKSFSKTTNGDKICFCKKSC